jgi:protocatechuate 3,4-dioxygenase beta subunit
MNDSLDTPASPVPQSRRRFLRRLASGLVLATGGAALLHRLDGEAFAQELLRTPHIHMKVLKGERELLTTQLYIQGGPMNAQDGVLRSIRAPRQRASVQVPFTPVKNSKIGELWARFDIVLGWTPPA